MKIPTGLTIEEIARAEKLRRAVDKFQEELKPLEDKIKALHPEEKKQYIYEQQIIDPETEEVDETIYYTVTIGLRNTLDTAKVISEYPEEQFAELYEHKPSSALVKKNLGKTEAEELYTTGKTLALGRVEE